MEHRTLELNVLGMEALDTGFVIEGNQIRTYKRLQDKPTCQLFMKENTFVALALGEISFQSGFCYGLIEVKGENWLRDLTILQRMFDENGHLFSKMKEKK